MLCGCTHDPCLLVKKGSSLTEPHHVGGEIKAEGRKRLLLSFWRVPGLCPQRGTSWTRTTVCSHMDLGLRASKHGPHREGCCGPPSPKVHPEARPPSLAAPWQLSTTVLQHLREPSVSTNSLQSLPTLRSQRLCGWCNFTFRLWRTFFFF